jgi:type IV secretion system protein VirD4
MSWWEKVKKSVENVDLDAMKKAALDKIDEAREAKTLADAKGESFLNWDGIKKHVEKINPDKINNAASAALDAAERAAQISAKAALATGLAVQLPDARGNPTLTWDKIRAATISGAIKGANAFVEWNQDWAERAAQPSAVTFGSAFTASSKELEAKGLGVKIPRFGDKSFDSSGLLLGSYARGLLTYKGDTHHLVVAASGAGKFQGGVGVWLDNGLPAATVLIDPKGEAARLFAPALDQAAVLDPWNEAGFGTSSLNLLDDLTSDNPNLVDDARALADALIIPSGGDTHWDSTAKNFVAALLIFIALDPHEAGKRHLLRLRELVTLPWQGTGDAECMENLLTYLQQLDIAGGSVKRAAAAMAGRADKERQSIFSTIERDTAWLDSPQIQNVVVKSDLDLDRFAAALGERRGPVLFVVIPPRYLMTHRSWLRLVIAAASNAFKRVQIADPDALSDPWRKRRHIIIDEFPQLGRMAFVENDVAVARGYNIQYHLLVQNLTQLREAYAANWETFIANSLVQAFGVQDVFTSEYVSKMLGTTTVTSYGRSSSSTWSAQGSSSTSGSSSSPVGRPLRTPDEVRTLPKDGQFLFLRGMNPVAARLLWLYEKGKR